MNEATFVQLYQAYADRTFRRLLKMLGNVEDAEDASQQVWLRLWQHQPSGNHQDAWLCRVAENTAIDILRRRYTRYRHLDVSTIDEVAEWVEASQPSPQVAYDLSWRTQAAFSALGQKYQQALYLHHIVGLSIVEMSELLGDSPFALRTRLSRGRKAFRTAFTQQRETG